MSAPAQSSAEVASSPSAGLAGVVSAVANSRPHSATASDDLPVVGVCWRGKYEITAALAAEGGAQVWAGRTVDGGQAVVLRAFRPAEPDVRSQAWSKVSGIDSPHLQHARDSQRAGEWRVEIADALPGVPLNEWRASRPSIAVPTVKAVVGQIAEALGALHAFELVHLNVRPESIFVEGDGADVLCRVGGLDALTSFDRTEPLPAVVDPFYAPPEALGLNVHVPGPGLCAWDWWSLGRVIQELILGRHIVTQLAKPNSGAADLRSRAEALLLEADPKEPRAGAVETMTGLEAQQGLLLRGLLTSAKEARWTGDNVDRWVRALPVKEHYATPRTDTHFRWRGRPCTVPEIAAVLQSADHWSDNGVQLFEATTPGTLAHFLRWSTNQSAANDQLTSALELAESLPLKMSSPAAQREVVTAVSLLQLSAGKLVWRGRNFEAATVSAMFSELGETDALMVLQALTTRSTALQIERIDPAAGRFLTELGRTVSDAEAILRRHGWLAAHDAAAHAKLFRLAVDSTPNLRAIRETLAQTFAGSDHAAMEKIFKAANIGRAEMVVIGWGAAEPARYKFFTHAEAARRRAETVRARGAEIAQALTWVQLERALNVGRIVFGGWDAFFLTWGLAGAVVALLWPGVLGLAYAAIPMLAALGVRYFFAARNAHALREHVADIQWSWRDGPARCRRELRVAGRGAAAAALESELESVRKDLVTLKDVQPPPVPLPPLPTFASVRFAGTMAWVLFGLFVLIGGWRVYSHPVSFQGIKTAWAVPPPEVKADAKAATAAAKETTEEKSSDVKVTWPFRPGDSAAKAVVLSADSATSEQSEAAAKRGREIVAPFLPDTVSTLIFVPVSAGSESAVMIFDGKRGELYNDQVYKLAFAPIPRSWVEVSGRKGIYLER
jgi:hypothetical protein